MREEQGTIEVSKMYKEGSVVKKEDVDVENINVMVFPDLAIPIAEVECTSSITLNLGNYESAKIGVSVRLPCFVEELQDAYTTAKKFVDDRLNGEAKEIRDWREKKE